MSGELWAAMDKVLRSVRSVDSLFGGVWVIGAGDHYQCGNMDEAQPMLLSLIVRHNFDAILMEQLYRHSGRSKNRGIWGICPILDLTYSSLTSYTPSLYFKVAHCICR